MNDLETKEMNDRLLKVKIYLKKQKMKCSEKREKYEKFEAL